MRVLQYSQNDSKTHQISRKHKHMRVIQSHQVKYRILPLDWVCGLYPGTILSLIAIQVWCEVTTNRPRRQSPIIFAKTSRASFIGLTYQVAQLTHSIAEQIAGNSLRPLPSSQRFCRLPSPENILAQTSAGKSPSLLLRSKSICKLSSAANRLPQTSRGNSFSLHPSRTSICRLPSVEKASACNLLRSFPPK